MKIAVVIPTRDRHDALGRCLAQLPSADPELTIVISDDGDVSQTRQALGTKFPHVHFIQGPRRGPAANRNCGATQTSSDLIVFLDDDCIPEPDLIEAYRQAATDYPEVACFEGRISSLGSPRGFGDCVPINETGGHLWSCNFAIRSSLFTQLHGFDERFVFAANEDMDMHLRVKKQGEVVFLPGARVFHHYETRLGAKPLRHKGLSSILYLQIHTPGAISTNARSYLRSAARLLLIELPKRIRAHTTANPFHLVRLVVYELKLSIMMAFWKYRGSMARLLYRPCCSGCLRMLEQIQNA